MANLSTSTRSTEHHIKIRRQALAALDTDMARRETLRALAEAIEILDERSLAFEVCTTVFCRYVRRLNGY